MYDFSDVTSCILAMKEIKLKILRDVILDAIPISQGIQLIEDLQGTIVDMKSLYKESENTSHV